MQRSTIVRERDQSCWRPVPPNSLTARFGLPESSRSTSTCGATSQAQTLADELTKRFPEDTLSQEIWLPLVRAALQLQRGNAAQVIEQLQTTARYEAVAECWPSYLRGQAYLKLGKAAEAAAEFRTALLMV